MSNRLYSPTRERIALPGRALSGLLSNGVKIFIARPIKRI
jgi:hypothetical protein